MPPAPPSAIDTEQLETGIPWYGYRNTPEKRTAIGLLPPLDIPLQMGALRTALPQFGDSGEQGHAVRPQILIEGLGDPLRLVDEDRPAAHSPPWQIRLSTPLQHRKCQAHQCDQAEKKPSARKIRVAAGRS